MSEELFVEKARKDTAVKGDVTQTSVSTTAQAPEQPESYVPHVIVASVVAIGGLFGAIHLIGRLEPTRPKLDVYYEALVLAVGLYNLETMTIFLLGRTGFHKRILDLEVALRRDLTSLKDTLDLVSKSVENVPQEIGARLSSLEARVKLMVQEGEFRARNRKSFLGKVLKRAYERVVHTLQIADSEFSVLEHGLAVTTYADFWSQLLEVTRPNTNLELRMIHTCDISVFTRHPLAIELFQKQHEFHVRGGQMTRIVCGPDKNPSADYREAMDSMLGAGVDVYYLCIPDNPMMDFQFSWDFLVVLPSGETVIWEGTSNLNHGVQFIKHARYLMTAAFERVDLLDLFERLKKSASKYTNPSIVVAKARLDGPSNAERTLGSGGRASEPQAGP